MEAGEKVCFVVSSEQAVSPESSNVSSTALCCFTLALMPLHSVLAQIFLCSVPLQCINTTLMQTNIQKHLDYISIIYNYSGTKIDWSLQLASYLRTAVLQQRVLCFESTAIITVDCILTTNNDCKAQLQEY